MLKTLKTPDTAAPGRDATFLNTEPELTCMGLLLFLEDATLDNGWSAPSSTTPCRLVLPRLPSLLPEAHLRR